MLSKEFRRHAFGGRLEGQSLRSVLAKYQRIGMSRSRVRPGATRALEAAGFVHVIERHCPFEQNLLLKKHRAGGLGCSPSTTRFVNGLIRGLRLIVLGSLFEAAVSFACAGERR